MRFKIDENLPEELASLLRSRGHDAATVLTQNLGGNADATIADVCRAEGRAIITLDVGFGNIRFYPPADYAGIIVIRLGTQARDHILAIVNQLLPLLDRERLAVQERQELETSGSWSAPPRSRGFPRAARGKPL